MLMSQDFPGLGSVAAETQPTKKCAWFQFPLAGTQHRRELAGSGPNASGLGTIFWTWGKVDSDIGFAGLYGRKYYGPAFVDFAQLGGYTANRSTRNVNNNLLANGLELATASFGGWFVSPEVAAGYHYDFAPGWTLTPAAHLRYLAAGYDGYTESRSTADMTVGNRILQNTEERADFTLTRTMDWSSA
jgi:outer membrane autotransporter protein